MKRRFFPLYVLFCASLVQSIARADASSVFYLDERGRELASEHAQSLETILSHWKQLQGTKELAPFYVIDATTNQIFIQNRLNREQLFYDFQVYQGYFEQLAQRNHRRLEQHFAGLPDLTEILSHKKANEQRHLDELRAAFSSMPVQSHQLVLVVVLRDNLVCELYKVQVAMERQGGLSAFDPAVLKMPRVLRSHFVRRRGACAPPPEASREADVHVEANAQALPQRERRKSPCTPLTLALSCISCVVVGGLFLW